MSNQFNIDRQLALRIVTGDFNAQQSAVAELRALLAAPVVERQPVELEGDGFYFAGASPPAPVAVVLPEFNEWYVEANLKMTRNQIEMGSMIWSACLDKVKEMNR